MLNLGLESLQVVEQPKVSLEQLYIDMQYAEMKLNEAYNDICSFMKDIVNFREVIKTAKKYSSEECKAFAAELLGMTVASLEEETAKQDADGANENVKSTFGDKMKKFGAAILNYLKKFGAWFKEQIKKLAALLIKKSKEYKPIKVQYDLDTIKKIGKACREAKKAQKEKLAEILTTALNIQPNTLTLNTAEAASQYFKLASGLIPVLYEAANAAVSCGDQKAIAAINKGSHRICGILQRDAARCFKAMSTTMNNNAKEEKQEAAADNNQQEEGQK